MNEQRTSKKRLDELITAWDDQRSSSRSTAFDNLLDDTIAALAQLRAAHEPLSAELLDVHAICDERDEWRRKYQELERIPDGWATVPKEADDWIASHIPADTSTDARAFYRRLVAIAELAGGASLRVRAWSCNSESAGHGRCVEWCRTIDKCYASVEVTHRPAQPPCDVQDDANRFRWGVKNARWIRHEHEAYVAIPVALAADLSCEAMRRKAVDDAMRATSTKSVP